jgi:hypothetical protein
MRVKISRTIELDDIPEEIDEVFGILIGRLITTKERISDAADEAREGRYVDASELLESARSSLVLIDKNLEEQQSLCLSYEKIRISNQMPPPPPQPPLEPEYE